MSKGQVFISLLFQLYSLFSLSHLSNGSFCQQNCGWLVRNLGWQDPLCTERSHKIPAPQIGLSHLASKIISTSSSSYKLSIYSSLALKTFLNWLESKWQCFVFPASIMSSKLGPLQAWTFVLHCQCLLSRRPLSGDGLVSCLPRSIWSEPIPVSRAENKDILSQNLTLL